MFTVYHLPQLEKVGCTNNFERRMKEQDVEPLDEYIKFKGTLEEASLVEDELRKFYNYKPDSNMTYREKFKTLEGNLSNTDKSILKSWTKSHFVGWNELDKGASKDDLRASMERFEEISLETKGGTFKFTRDDIPELVKKAKTSQHRDYYWATTNLEAIKKNENLRREDNDRSSIPEFEQIRAWATKRGLYEKGDPKTQYLKLQEEAGEVARAILKNDEPEIIDGLGDILVVLINLSHLCGYKLEDCLAEAYNVISKRKGKMINGTFVKNED